MQLYLPPRHMAAPPPCFSPSPSCCCSPLLPDCWPLPATARPFQATISEVLLSTTGLGLTALKCLVDDGGDWHSLHKLVFTDVVDNTAILAHFQRQAGLAGKQGRAKILSDLDDTLFASGGRWPAGCDSSKSFISNSHAIHMQLTCNSHMQFFQEHHRRRRVRQG